MRATGGIAMDTHEHTPLDDADGQSVHVVHFSTESGEPEVEEHDVLPLPHDPLRREEQQ
jgi:hypothetical protein